MIIRMNESNDTPDYPFDKYLDSKSVIDAQAELDDFGSYDVHISKIYDPKGKFRGFGLKWPEVRYYPASEGDIDDFVNKLSLAADLINKLNNEFKDDIEYGY